MVWGLYARRWQSPVDEVLRVQLICYNPGLLLCESIYSLEHGKPSLPSPDTSVALHHRPQPQLNSFKHREGHRRGHHHVQMLVT